MKRMPVATALRTRCAERTCAMQLVCMYASMIIEKEDILIESLKV